MADTFFVNGTTLSDADWFNDVNRVVYTILGDPADTIALRTNAGINDLNEDTSPDTNADFIEVFDTSASTAKKVLLGRAKSATTLSLVNLSGTAVTFTNIPSWVKYIRMVIVNLSTNGTAAPRVTIGTSSGLETSGYDYRFSIVQDAQIPTVGFSTSAFIFSSGTSSGDALDGSVELMLANGSTTTWVCRNTFQRRGGVNQVWHGTGYKSISGFLERFSLTMNGTDQFDAGTILVHYE